MSAVRPGYKQTEVGVIPEEWEVEPLGSMSQLYQPVTIAASQMSEHGYPVYGANGLIGFYERANHMTWQVTVTCRGSTCGVVNRTANESWITGNAMVANVDHNAAVHKEFFFHVMCRQDFRVCITGTGQPQIVRTPLAAVKLALPPLLEQQAIAEALGDADALIERLEALIAKKRDIKQGAMQGLLTGHRRLPGFQGEWVEKKLGTCVAIRNEKVPTLGNLVARTCVELEQILPAVGQVDRFEDAAGRNAIKYRFYPDDVLFGRLRPYLRKYWLATVDGVCSTEIWPLVAQGGQVAQSFLFHVVQTEQFIEAASAAYGTHMPRADWKMIADFKLHLPPTVDEQRAIAAVLSDMDAEIAALEDKLGKARAVKQGMMQVLLTGEIRLI